MKCASMPSSTATAAYSSIALILILVGSLQKCAYSQSNYGLSGHPVAQPPMVRHPGTCTFQRSQTACTFSLLCYMAGGLPIEGCGGDIAMTCCMLYNGGGSANLNALGIQPVGGPPPPPPPSHHVQYHQQAPHVSQHHHEQPSYHEPPAYHDQSAYHYQPAYHYAAHHVGAGSPHPHASHALAHAAQPPPQSLVRPSHHLQAPQPQAQLPPPPPLQSQQQLAQQQSQHLAPPPPPLQAQSNYVSPMQPVSHQYVPVHTSPQYESVDAARRTVPATAITPDYGEQRQQYARNFAGEDVCGKPSAKPTSRIIGGQDAYFGEFPWQVHIKIAKHQCGGALVNRDYIITAAHCVYQAPLHQLSIIIGAYDIEDHRYQEEPPQFFSVAEVRLHPNFRFSASHPDRYDVAVLRLDKAARYTDNVLPVCLPPKDIQFEGWHGLVTGWGKTDPALSNRYGTRLLQKVDVPIIKNNECENWHQTRGIDLKIFPEMMCAGYEGGQKDACVGDSGGPLVVFLNGRWTLAGITSAGFGCAQSRQPGIYHRLPMTVDWVLANIVP